MSTVQRPRRRKRVLIALVALLYIAAVTTVQITTSTFQAPAFWARLFFYLLLNINTLALVGLIYFVGKSLVRLVQERRRGMVGHRFKTRVVGIFLVIVSIPISVLFFISSELVTNYIDRFFAPEFRRPMEASVQIASTVYTIEKNRALDLAQLARDGAQLPHGYEISIYYEPPEDSSSALQAAFTEGVEATEVITTDGGDMIRAAVPLPPNALGERPVLVVETMLSEDTVEKIELVRDANEQYMHLEAWRKPLKKNYMMLLAFFTLLIIFTSIWVALRVAAWITEPVKRLAEATGQVAEGNYAVMVEEARQDELGQLIRSFNHMVNEIRDSKESLQHAFANLDNIVSNIRSGVVSIDSAGIIRSINSAACGIFGIVEGDVLGRDYRAILTRVDSEGLKELAKGIDVRSLTEVEREVWATVRKAKVLLRVFVSGLKNKDGVHMGMLVVVDDISDIIKAQRAVAWQEVARRMAHEIKNPLTPIRLSAERMLKKWDNKSEDFDQVFERSIRTIIREVDGLKSMVDEFSRFGKMPEIKPKPTSLASVVGEVVSLYKDYKEIRVAVEIPESMPEMDMDGAQMKRVFINLFDNAIEAMQKEGGLNVWVNYDTAANRVEINVADTGPGINEEDKERLFQPYFSTKKDGTGLGLAIADRIIAEHGGNISVEDAVPRGTRFRIKMPIRIR